MVDNKKRVGIFGEYASVIIGGTAIVLGLLSQVYFNHSLKSLRQQDIDSYQHWWNTVQRELEFYELAEEKGSAIGAYVEIARRRGLVEIVECGDDSLSDFKNTQKP